MSDKSFIDNLFDAADAALTPMEKVLSDTPVPQKQDPDRHEDWEKSFDTVQWATVGHFTDKEGSVWHAFPEASMRALCGKNVETTFNRQVLAHGKTIPACTSCIIAVSK